MLKTPVWTASLYPEHFASGIAPSITNSKLNRPGNELTPRSWTNFKGFHGKVPN